MVIINFQTPIAPPSSSQKLYIARDLGGKFEIVLIPLPDYLIQAGFRARAEQGYFEQLESSK